MALVGAAFAGGARAAPVRAPDATPPTAPAVAPQAPTGPLVRSVELHLSEGADPAGLAPLVTLRVGLPLRRQDARRTLERLHGTGRFADLSITARPAPDGRVDVVIAARARVYIDRLDFEGNRALPEAALRKALAIQERRPEYYPEFVERLVARLEEAYQRIGHTRVRIEHLLLQGELGEKVLSFRIAEGAPTRLVAVHVGGDPQLPADEIVRTLGMGPGAVLDRDLLDRGLAALKARYRAEGHYRARFGAPEVTERDGEAALLLPITAGPSIEFRFKGNDAFEDSVLQRRLQFDPEEALDEALLAQLEERIAAFYRLNGFADVQVAAREVRSRDRKRSFIVFHVDEGAPLQVVGVSFQGNRHFTEAFLLERLEESLLEIVGEAGSAPGSPNEVLAGGPPRKRGPRSPEPAVTWYEPAYQHALARIVELYRADGFLGVYADPPLLERDEGRREAKVSIRLHEGPQTIVSEVVIEGGDWLKALVGGLPVKKGKPLNSLEVETSRQVLQRALGRSGHVFARVLDEERLSADRTEAKVTFRVTEGPKVRVGRILIQGLSRTEESVVRGALALHEGKPLDLEGLAQSQRNLVRLGIFRTVALRMNAPEVPEEIKDVYVSLEERPTQSVMVGFGYAFIDGPRLLVEYTKVNLFGQALQGQVRNKVNYANFNFSRVFQGQAEEGALQALGGRFDASLQYPRVLSFLPVEVSARGDLVGELINRPLYRFQHAALLLGTELPGLHGLSSALAWGFEADNIERAPGTSSASSTLSPTDIARLRFDEGKILLYSLRPTVTYDRRDDPANPHRGVLLNLTTEVVQSLGGELVKPDGSTAAPNSFFVRASAQGSLYVPVLRRMVLALSVKAGKIFPLVANSSTIVPKRFFLGGANSMRGFPDDALIAEDQRGTLHEQIAQCNVLTDPGNCTAAATAVSNGESLLSEGGELFVLGRAELRFPISGQLEGAFFSDFGNLWLDQAQFDVTRLRYTAGAGLRIVTPVGPAAIDLGINLAPDRALNEAMVVPHFSIGLF